MHRIEIPPSTVGRIEAQRGALHMLETIEPAKTAHLIVDLQNGFMAPDQLLEIAAAREIIPDVNRICAAVRAAGGLNGRLRSDRGQRRIEARLVELCQAFLQ